MVTGIICHLTPEEAEKWKEEEKYLPGMGEEVGAGRLGSRKMMKSREISAW